LIVFLAPARSGGRANNKQARDTERDDRCEPDCRFHPEPPTLILRIEFLWVTAFYTRRFFPVSNCAKRFASGIL
jgi:hypothetical protein